MGQPAPGRPRFHRGAEELEKGDGLVALSGDEARLLKELRAGDERAFTDLVQRHQAALVRLAMVYVRTRASAEEVVQETWLAVVRGLDRFESRSSLKTWIFRILMNLAMTRGKRESRSVSFAALFDAGREPAGPSVDPARFQGSGGALPGHWLDPPPSWPEPQERVLTKEALSVIGKAIRDLPPSQAEVITLRDVEGWTSREVCSVLAISETNQRVLLHRARTRLRERLANYFEKQ